MIKKYKFEAICREIILGNVYKSTISNNLIKVTSMNISGSIDGPFLGTSYNDDTINKFKLSGGGFTKNTLILASEDENKWLNKCIELNKFITKEEVLKEDFEIVPILNKLPEMLSLDNIKDKLSKYYDKDDVKEILEILNK